MKNVVFWNVAPSRSCVSRRFGGTYRLNLQSKKIHERRTCVSRCHLWKLRSNALVSMSLQLSAFVSIETVFRIQLVSKNQSLRGNVFTSSFPRNVIVQPFHFNDDNIGADVASAIIYRVFMTTEIWQIIVRLCGMRSHLFWDVRFLGFVPTYKMTHKNLIHVKLCPSPESKLIFLNRIQEY
jgi:hypothetical protein